jgi:hypothetical protein
MKIATYASVWMVVPLGMISTEINPYMSQNTVTIAVPAEEEQ